MCGVEAGTACRMGDYPLRAALFHPCQHNDKRRTAGPVRRSFRQGQTGSGRFRGGPLCRRGGRQRLRRAP